MFDPNDDFKSIWDVIIMSLALYNCFSVPIDVAYEPKTLKNPFVRAINFLIDFMFLMDIGVCFRTTFINNVGREVVEPCEIAWNYI